MRLARQTPAFPKHSFRLFEALLNQCEAFNVAIDGKWQLQGFI
jgi:hypothetical protein